jgi:hypothetical protein
MHGAHSVARGSLKRLETCWSRIEPMSEPQTDGDHYVGHDVAGQHIGLVPDPGMTSPRGYVR